MNTTEPVRFDAVELDEPHFDEEATLLSARPVVPLEVVEKRARSSQRWAFAAVVVVALVVGALSATLIYNLISTTQTPVTHEDSLVQPPLPGLEAGIGAIASETPSPAFTATPRPENLADKVTTRPNVSSRTQPVAVSRERAPIARANEEDQIIEERENRRAEKRERRRQRRADREAQRNADARSNDLQRIREIFEGAPRP